MAEINTRTVRTIRLDPATEPARIRAFFVLPDWSRRGVGNLLLRECERAARASGFRRLELMATRTGEPFYARAGFRVLERVNLELPGGVSFLLPGWLMSNVPKLSGEREAFGASATWRRWKATADKSEAVPFCAPR